MRSVARVRLVRHHRYADLAEAVAHGLVDLAWLPPGVYVRIRRNAGVRAVAMLERSGATRYRSALLARNGTFASIDDVVRARAAWVDPWSAAGYLAPRATLLDRGIDLSAAIASERFCRSYDTAVDELTVRVADIAGAFCTVASDGKIVERGWSAAAPVRVLAISDPIPADLLCTSRAVSLSDAMGIQTALTVHGGWSIASALGGSALSVPEPDAYDALERVVTIDGARLASGHGS